LYFCNKQQALIYGYSRWHMIYLFLFLISWDLISSINNWLLVCLRQQRQRSSLGQQVDKIIWAIWIKKKIITYVKNEGSNLNIVTIASKSIVKCEVLTLDESFQGTCFGHSFSQACENHATNEKVYRNFRFVSVKSTQSNLHKCITWL
jgi:hypothetical protein